MNQMIPFSWSVYHSSKFEDQNSTYFLVRTDNGKRLCILGNMDDFQGVFHSNVLVCRLTSENARALREKIPWLKPKTLGLKTSMGFGDRLGLATPGHVNSLQNFNQFAPIFAQQSVRENLRTGRTPLQVLDDAMWGVFQAGWRRGWGADADHIKTETDLESFINSGYTFFTIDPGDHVDNNSDNVSKTILETKFKALPWDILESTPEDSQRHYVDHIFDIGTYKIRFNFEDLWRAGAKYGHAIAHSAQIFRFLNEFMKERSFELEISVDETESPTTPKEHYYFANELKRLGVRWVSLAPRFLGTFEKGIDYIGNLELFASDFAKHVAIAQHLGPYKLSLHSGSDKFSIYFTINKLAKGLVHIKTAGTSYLEALRVVSQFDPLLFRNIMDLAIDCYERERMSYHVSGRVKEIPDSEEMSDNQLERLLDHPHSRQVLHVTYGSILEQFGEELTDLLISNEDRHYEFIATHFRKHLSSFYRTQY